MDYHSRNVGSDFESYGGRDRSVSDRYGKRRYPSHSPSHYSQHSYPKYNDDSYGRRDDRYENRQRREHSSYSSYSHTSYPPSHKRATPNELAQKDSFFSLKEFLNRQDLNINEQEALRMYSEYKELYLKYHLEQFFEENKHLAWFRDIFSASGKTRNFAEVHKLKEIENNSFFEAWKNAYFDDCCLDEYQSELEDNLDEAVDAESSDESTEKLEQSATTPRTVHDSIKKCFVYPLNFPCLLIKNVPPSLPRDLVSAAVKKIIDYKALLFANASIEQKFFRNAWIILETGTDLNGAMDLFENSRLKIENETDLEITYCSISANPRIRTCPEIARTEDRLRKDLALAVAICNKFCKETELSCPVDCDVANDELSMEQCKKQLDLLITYLRRVHFFCFYCGIQTETPNELIQQCGNVHIRKINSMKSPQFLADWANRYESRNQAFLGISNVFSPSIPNRIFKEHSLDDEISLKILKVEEGKFRCTICLKMFKGPEFVDKHIRLKHPENVSEIEQEINMYSSFARDFVKLQEIVPQYFNTTTSTPEHFQERRPHRDFYKTSRPSYQPTSRPYRQPPPTSHFEGRSQRTYADLDAPASGDVELFY